jgi:hypothetical protein
MDALSSIFTWLSDHEAGISGVVGTTVLAGVLFAGVRSLVRRRGDFQQGAIAANEDRATTAPKSSLRGR